MRNVVIDKDGYRYRWVIRGEHEDACADVIAQEGLVRLPDYLATVIAEKYGCIAEVSWKWLMTHNQYQRFLQNNVNRLRTDDGYSLADYRRDAGSVEVLPFDLAQLQLAPEVEAYINRRFASSSFTKNGDVLLKGYVLSFLDTESVGAALECEMIALQAYSGFYKNDSLRATLEFSEGEISLVLCETQRAYALQLAELNQRYGVENYDICLEIYFDSVHVDNLFPSRDNVGVLIGSLLQRGYEGYNPSVKRCWENMLRRSSNPKLGFRVVALPEMVNEILQR